MKTLRRTLLLTLALVAASLGDAPAQSTRPVFQLDPGRVFGAFVGPSIRVGGLFRQSAWLAGGATAIVIDHRLAVGIEGTALVSHVEVLPDGSRASLRMLYGGVIIEYLTTSERRIAPVFRATVGGGGVRYVDRKSLMQSLILMVDMPVDGPDDAFFYVEPGLGLEARLSAWIHVELSALFRVVSGVSTPGMTNGDISGPSLVLTTKLGWF
jgi:hypothetical protein